jgi:hypothetical protein
MLIFIRLQLSKHSCLRNVGVEPKLLLLLGTEASSGYFYNTSKTVAAPTMFLFIDDLYPLHEVFGFTSTSDDNHSSNAYVNSRVQN